jgi:hypothetical protein
MANPHTYFVDERWDGTIAVKGQGKHRAARVLAKGKDEKAISLAHHFAGRPGVVEFRGADGRFECDCPRCKANS